MFSNESDRYQPQQNSKFIPLPSASVASKKTTSTGVNKQNIKKKGKSVKKKISLKEEAACYILISCGEPSDDGKISVEMTYEGDPILATYLLQSAQGFIEDQEDGFSN